MAVGNSNKGLIDHKKRRQAKRDPIKSAFLEDAGYSEDDVLAWNPTTRFIQMKNGGRYKLLPNKVLHFDGPSPDPSERL